MAQDADGRSLWELTWSRARVISSGLQPQLLAASGVADENIVWQRGVPFAVSNCQRSPACLGLIR